MTCVMPHILGFAGVLLIEPKYFKYIHSDTKLDQHRCAKTMLNDALLVVGDVTNPVGGVQHPPFVFSSSS